jgi:hypothetical protein
MHSIVNMRVACHLCIIKDAMDILVMLFGRCMHSFLLSKHLGVKILKYGGATNLSLEEKFNLLSSCRKMHFLQKCMRVRGSPHPT